MLLTLRFWCVSHHGWPFTLRGSCGAELRKLPQWLLPLAVAANYERKTKSEKVFVSQERVSGFPEKLADLRGSPGNFRGSPGNFRGSLGNFRGTSGLLLSSTVRELPGKSPKNFRGSPGTSQKLGGAWLPPSDSPNLSPTKGQQLKGKIVSEFFTLFHNFPPGTCPFKTKGFSSRRTKEKKR